MAVDLSGLTRGDEGSRRLFAACLSSIEARRADLPEGAPGRPTVLAQEGLHHLVVTELGPLRLMMNSDGLGTKVEVAERVGRYDTLAFDLLAMLVDDAVRFGAEPLCATNVLDIARADGEVIAGLARGLEAAAATAGIAIVGGEVAELGARVAGRGASGGLNWAGTLLSLLRRGQELTGELIAAGDSIVAIREPGLRSNGFTLARAVLQRAYGEAWHEAAAPSGIPFGEALLTPSRIYAPAVLDLIGRATRDEPARAPVHAVVHVTGGGVPGKLERVLAPRGLGAVLDDLFAPGEALAALQALGEVDDKAAYRAWNMGQGLLVVTPAPALVMAAFVARGHEARIAGRVVAGRALHLVSRGCAHPGTTLTFERKESP